MIHHGKMEHLKLQETLACEETVVINHCKTHRFPENILKKTFYVNNLTVRKRISSRMGYCISKYTLFNLEVNGEFFQTIGIVETIKLWIKISFKF